eukprot:1161864-Pelagomonas_calceolata.AAC.29
MQPYSSLGGVSNALLGRFSLAFGDGFGLHPAHMPPVALNFLVREGLVAHILRKNRCGLAVTEGSTLPSQNRGRLLTNCVQ